MDKVEVLRIIAQFRAALDQVGVRAEQVILYGSYASDTAHEGSDIDLIVVSKDFEGKGYWQRIDLMVEALMQVWQPIEAIAMTPEEWETGDSMIAMFARSGEVAYSA